MQWVNEYRVLQRTLQVSHSTCSMNWQSQTQVLSTLLFEHSLILIMLKKLCHSFRSKKLTQPCFILILLLPWSMLAIDNMFLRTTLNGWTLVIQSTQVLSNLGIFSTNLSLSSLHAISGRSQWFVSREASYSQDFTLFSWKKHYVSTTSFRWASL